MITQWPRLEKAVQRALLLSECEHVNLSDGNRRPFKQEQIAVTFQQSQQHVVFSFATNDSRNALQQQLLNYWLFVLVSLTEQ